MRRPGATSKGFTLVELVIVIAVIAILAALLLPVVLGQVERSRQAAERQSLRELASALRRFKLDTTYWPKDDSIWDVTTDFFADELNAADTALFKMPTMPAGFTALTQCNLTNIGYPCWNGPYVSSSAKGTNSNDAYIDAWGKNRMIILIRPLDGMGGGTPGAPGGFVAIWSRGPDREDSFSCTGTPAGCTRDLDKMARALTSATATSTGGTPDDIIFIVGTAR